MPPVFYKDDTFTIIEMLIHTILFANAFSDAVLNAKTLYILIAINTIINYTDLVI